ncbi:DUF5020 family protein [Aestuariibacter halophilus]|uniref:DUF5020 family protein n=1 Tax=Fluctibacter halophilus TaxID=226011 RepID=A0ABS8GAG7_9ALTE|nr:DUF5020 family protein [Aestuariibacter halophilus]MCC2617555.1 DUF5020 family protein [Aestuariibacter halophilus]
MKKVVLWWLAMLPVSALANVQWSNYSLTYLRGEHYAVGDPARQVVTFEYTAAADWGGVFLFIDRIHPDSGDASTYGELTPRFLIAKDALPVPVYIATTIEKGHGFTHLLYGLGVDVPLPGFRYAQLNLYRRINDDKDDNWQLTPVWGVPFSVGESQWLFSGFVDWVSGTRTNASGYHFNAQIGVDVGSYVGLDSTLRVGIEYAHWKNKFGIQGVTENNANLMLKWYF